MKKMIITPEETQIIIRFGIYAETCNKLGGNPRQDNICGFVLVRPEDYKKIPKNVDYDAVIDNAIQSNQFFIEGESALKMIQKTKQEEK